MIHFSATAKPLSANEELPHFSVSSSVTCKTRSQTYTKGQVLFWRNRRHKGARLNTSSQVRWLGLQRLAGQRAQTAAAHLALSTSDALENSWRCGRMAKHAKAPELELCFGLEESCGRGWVQAETTLRIQATADKI